jgi:phosphoribosylanthranilate isomerase
MTIGAKICGLSTPETVTAALEGGAAFVGFVSFPKSLRHVEPARAAALAVPARNRAAIVAVTVDPTDAELDALMAVLNPDFIQLHGHETPARAAEVRARTGGKVIKALPVSTAADLDAAAAFADVTDHLMFDARPPEGADLPGGLGERFDWRLLAGRSFARPWFLAGGLTPENVADAIRGTGAPLVDVSSGVETGPGLKDGRLIAAFLTAVRSV